MAHKTRTRLIDVSNVAASVGPEVCIALLGLHAFTCCDTVSAFAGKGKICVLTIWKANAELKEAFAQLGVCCTVECSSKFACEVGGVRMQVPCHKTGHREH